MYHVTSSWNWCAIRTTELSSQDLKKGDFSTRRSSTTLSECHSAIHWHTKVHKWHLEPVIYHNLSENFWSTMTLTQDFPITNSLDNLVYILIWYLLRYPQQTVPDYGFTHPPRVHQKEGAFFLKLRFAGLQKPLRLTSLQRSAARVNKK